MRYDISKASVPTLPTLGKGTKCIKICSKKPPKYVFKTIKSMSSSVICAHNSDVEFQSQGIIWRFFTSTWPFQL